MKIQIRTGPFRTCLHSSIPAVQDGVGFFYADCSGPPAGGFYDFHIRLERPAGARRWFRPQVRFLFDGKSPFKPLPLVQAYPMFEWGLNWCITRYCHWFLMIHSAVIEREGRVVILPGNPGAGKSTLCAGLIHRGWRLYSDELALVSMADGLLTPLPRPVSLKNESIEVIRGFADDAEIGPVVFDTSKGTVAHLKPPMDSVDYPYRQARPAAIVFPRYEAGSRCRFDPAGKAESFMDVAKNTFNYNVLGQRAFSRLGQLIDQCECYNFVYSRLDDAASTFEALDSALPR